MANHPSAVKRAKQAEHRKLHNKYHARTTRNVIKELRNATNKSAAQKLLPKLTSMLDKLSKKHIIHKNKAANLKSSLTKHVNSL